MTAEEAARNGGGEARKAEVVAKVPVAASPEQKAAEEREGVAVSGAVVIANGNSGYLSEKRSDLEAKPDPALDEEEKEVPESNAAPDAAVVGDHEGDADPDASLNGHGHAAMESEDHVEESTGEQSVVVAPELAVQGVAVGERDGADISMANGDYYLSMSADSAAAVETVVRGGESKGEESAVDATELVEPEVAGGEQDAADVSLANRHDHPGMSADSGADETKGEESVANVEELVEQEVAVGEQGRSDVLMANGHDHANRSGHSGAAAAELELHGDGRKGEESAADAAELVDQEAASGEQDETDVSMANGHDHDNLSADSGAAAAVSKICANRCKRGKSAADATELVKQEIANGEQDRLDVSMANGHDHDYSSADSGAAPEETEACTEESKAEQSAVDVVELMEQARVPKIEDQGSEEVVKVARSNVHREDEALATGHGHAEESADAAAELGPFVEGRVVEAVPVVAELGDRADNDSKEIVQDALASGAAHSAEESEPTVEDRKDEAVSAVAVLEERVEKTCEEIVQDVELAKDDGDVRSLQPVELESGPSAGLGEDQKVQMDVAATVESTEETSVQADSEVELKTARSAQTQELGTAVDVEISPGHLNSIVQVEKQEIMEPAYLEEANLASVLQGMTHFFLEADEHKQLETPSDHLADKNYYDKLDAEPKQESVKEAVHGAQLQADAETTLSTFHYEPRSLDSVDSDGAEHSSPAPELETQNCAQREDSSPQENSSTVVQVEPDASKENEPVGIDEAAPGSYSKDESVVVLEAGTSSHGDKPNDIGKDSNSAGHGWDRHPENAVDASSLEDQLEVCNISTPCGTFSSGTGNIDSTPINELASSLEKPSHSDGALGEASCPDEETCSSDGTCKEICSENLNAFTKSSHEVETKCMEAVESTSVDIIVNDEHQDDDEHVHEDDTKIKDSSESHLESNTNKDNKGEVQVVIQERIFIIKVPKFAGEDLWEKIQEAQVHLDQSTQRRDAINVRKQKQKVLCDEYREKLEAARQDERGARSAHGDKRQDLNSVQSVIGKLNKANSIEEIDQMIAMKNKIIVHETIPLKDEKLLIQEIKELKVQRKQLYSHMGSKAEINEAFHQKDHIHERHKTLKKDSDDLLNNLKSLEEKTKVIQKAYDDERAVLRKLNEEYRAAIQVRQKAYDDWSEMKNESGRKNKYFFMYKNDRNTASGYLSMGDMVGLQLYCNNQVETFMEMWNKDEDFRRQYVEANKSSTLRRLGTTDGRKLGPHEFPPDIPSNSNRITSNQSPLPVSRPRVPTSTSVATAEKSTPPAALVKEDSFPILHGPHTAKRTKSIVSGSTSQQETPSAPVPERDVEHNENEKIRRMEELELARHAEELARREEELRKEKAAAEKEQLRLEQKAKAKEAEERKRRKVEKAQERAEHRARKEAEMKEKKKAKKDSKKGATSADSAIGSGKGNNAAIATTDTDSSTTENAQEADVPQHTAPKRPSRSSVAMKQLNRVQPIPLPPRNRGKRKMRQYLLVVLAVLSVLVLFVAGNYISLSDFTSLAF